MRFFTKYKKRKIASQFNREDVERALTAPDAPSRLRAIAAILSQVRADTPQDQRATDSFVTLLESNAREFDKAMEKHDYKLLHPKPLEISTVAELEALPSGSLVSDGDDYYKWRDKFYNCPPYEQYELTAPELLKCAGGSLVVLYLPRQV